MLAEFNRLARKPKFGLGLSFLAVLLYNNWLMGLFLNRNLFDHNGSVSEFSALTQPHFWVFRSLDIISGVILVLVALAMKQVLPGRSRSRALLIYGTVVLGVANIVDASFALRCSETLNAGCNIPVSLSLGHLELPSHAYSSVVIAVCYLLLPIAGLVFAARQRLNIFLAASAVTAIVALESLLSALIQYQDQNAISVRASGVSQEFQMLVLAVWFLVWAWSAYPKQAWITKRKLPQKTT